MVGTLKVNVRGRDRFERYLIGLPKRIKKEYSKTNKKFAEAVVQKAKEFAPKDTGSLAADIQKRPVRRGKKVNIWKMFVDNPAASPQEFGFTPHYAPIFNSSKMVPGIYWVSKNTPFMVPAIEHVLSRMSQQLENAARRVIIT